MKSSSQIKIYLENSQNIHLVCETDCSLGTIYDFTCALQNFVLKKMQELQPAPTEETPARQPVAEEERQEEGE